MALKQYRPTTPGQRQLVLIDRTGLHKGDPVKALTEGKHSHGGRNNTGRVTVRWQGGGHKQRYRIIDFKRRKFDQPARVERLEYDPNRTSFIALIKYKDGELAYILAPQRLAAGDTVVSGEKVDVKPGNAMKLASMPVGTIVHNIELKPGRGGQIARSAGTYAQYLGRDAGYALLRLNSSEVRRVRLECMATVGAVSNPDHMNEVIGKAGRNVWKGKRPSVRGTAMNPIDHPHGGGEGRTKGGRHPVTPWGKGTKGNRRARTSGPPSSSSARVKERRNDTFGLEGPVRRRLSAEEGGSDAGQRSQGSDQDMVAPFDDPAPVRGHHVRRLQRPQAHSRAGDGRHGGPQARRVLADAHLLRPRRRRQEGKEVGLMGKQSLERVLADNQARAVGRMVRISPRKLNLVAQSIRGLSAERALNELSFSRKRIAGQVKKVLQSAIANAENNHDLDVDDLVVTEASVGKNLVMKRFHARARGHAGGIEKFFSQITIVVEEKKREEEEEKAAKKAKSARKRGAKNATKSAKPAANKKRSSQKTEEKA